MADHAAIAVIGAGYAGLFAARRASRALPPGAGRIVLIDTEDVWQERTRWHQIAAGEDVDGLSRAALFDGTGVDVLTATVTDMDLEGRRLEFSGAERGSLTFDRLVYTPGSMSWPASVDGAAEYALALDTASASRRIATALRDRRGSRVVIIGGGLTGIQTATQIADNFPTASVTLVSSGPLGHEFPENTRGRIVEALDRLRVTRRENIRVTAIDSTGIDWAHGRLDADVVVWTAGFTPSPLAARAGLRVSESDQVVVDDTLRSVSHPWVFAAGDAASISRAASPYGAYAATGTGATAGKNAALDIAGKATKPLDLGYAFLSVSLGRRDAVLQLLHADGRPRDRMLAGRMIHLVKEGIERYVVGALKAERRIPGLYRWSPGPRSHGSNPSPE